MSDDGKFCDATCKSHGSHFEVVFWPCWLCVLAGSYLLPNLSADASPVLLTAWIGSALLLVGGLAVHAILPRHLARQPEATREKIGFLLAAAAALTAGSWTGAGLLLSSPNVWTSQQIKIICLLCGTTLAALIPNGAHFVMVALLIMPLGISAIVVMQRQAAPTTPATTAMTIAYLPVALYAAWRYCTFAAQTRLRWRQRKTLVAVLDEQREQAQAHAAAQTRQLVAASIALRQPVHAISLYLGALASHHEPSIQRSALLAQTRNSAYALDLLFRAILELARLDAGAVRPVLQTFTLLPLLLQATAAEAAGAAAGGQHWRVAPCRAQVRADPALLVRLLELLCQNIVQHAGPCRVLIGCRRRGGRLRVLVQDNGQGIAPHLRHSLFEVVSHPNKRFVEHSHGIGLGLSIARRLAQLQGGNLILQSRQGAGCCFEFDLALADSEPAMRPLASTNLGGTLVVAIDDDPFSLEVLVSLLRSAGCCVVSASSGAEAILQLTGHPRRPDLIVADYWLDNETGFDAISSLRDEFNHAIPAFLVTGHVEARHLEPAGLPVLPKPLIETDLRFALQQLLHQEVG